MKERERENERSDQASDDRSPIGQRQIYDQPGPEVDFGRNTLQAAFTNPIHLSVTSSNRPEEDERRRQTF